MTQRLYAFTLANRLKLASLEVGGGTTHRLQTVRSLTLTLDGNEQLIAFDPAQTPLSEGFTVNPGGTITVDVDGYYRGDLSIYLDKSGGAGVDIALWIEKKPLATGVWELASAVMSNPIVFNDGGVPVILPGHIDALAGDEFRIMIKENAGVGSLITVSQVVGLGTITQFAASLSADRIGPPNP